MLIIPHLSSLSWVAVGWKLGAGRLECVRAAGYSTTIRAIACSLPAANFQPTATQERDGKCGNQHYSRELLMMGIVVPETC